MLDKVVNYFADLNLEQEEDERPRIAIVGKPNVGKSSIINKLQEKVVLLFQILQEQQEIR